MIDEWMGLVCKIFEATNNNEKDEIVLDIENLFT